MYVAFLTRRGGFISRHAVRAFPLYKWGELSFWLVWRVAAARRPGVAARRNNFTGCAAQKLGALTCLRRKSCGGGARARG
jgi:hypothetical protein